jgi:NAD(P)-dependent dehydrogenase (short-subunit alcohol dehydrogenase family)
MPRTQPTTPRLEFAGRVVLVTGAAGGIGTAVSTAFAARGATVVACDRAPLDDTRRDVLAAADGAEIVTEIVDIAVQAQVDDVVERTMGRFGRLDVAVCNAGVRSRVPFANLDGDEWHRVLDTNLLGTFYTCRAAMAHMTAAEQGRIITISSLAGQLGGTLVNAAYSAAKAGIIVLTKVAAKECAPFNVTVNSISPGTIDTPFIADYDDSLRDSLRALIPLGRLGTADDIAGAALYLASDGAAWVTGTTLSVSGGQVML